MGRVHKEEMIRWVNSPEGTGTWSKVKDSRGGWQLLPEPMWREAQLYIVNDEWAELRKAQADGKQLQYWVERNIYTDAVLDINMESTEPKDWRIKPEIVYEWQLMYNFKDNYGITRFHYETFEEAQKASDYKIIEPYEPSKQEVTDV